MVAGKGRSRHGAARLAAAGAPPARGSRRRRRSYAPTRRASAVATATVTTAWRRRSAAFAKRESKRYCRGRSSSPSTASSSSGSSSHQRPPTALVVKMEDAEPELPRLPHFAPGDYLDDEQFKLILSQLGVHAGLAPGDFVAERELDTVVGLVARSSQQDADKAAEWRHIAVEQERVFVDLVSDEE